MSVFASKFAQSFLVYEFAPVFSFLFFPKRDNTSKTLSKIGLMLLVLVLVEDISFLFFFFPTSCVMYCVDESLGSTISIMFHSRSITLSYLTLKTYLTRQTHSEKMQS